MQLMFDKNKKLDVDLSLWDVSNVINFQGMFNDCTAMQHFFCSSILLMDNVWAADDKLGNSRTVGTPMNNGIWTNVQYWIDVTSEWVGDHEKFDGNKETYRTNCDNEETYCKTTNCQECLGLGKCNNYNEISALSRYYGTVNKCVWNQRQDGGKYCCQPPTGAKMINGAYATDMLRGSKIQMKCCGPGEYYSKAPDNSVSCKSCPAGYTPKQDSPKITEW